MEQFNKLDNYESRFSDQVWAGVSQHLEQQKKQKRTRRAFYIGATSVLLLTAVVGYTSLSDNSIPTVNLDTLSESSVAISNQAKTYKEIHKTEPNQKLEQAVLARDQNSGNKHTAVVVSDPTANPTNNPIANQSTVLEAVVRDDLASVIPYTHLESQNTREVTSSTSDITRLNSQQNTNATQTTDRNSKVESSSLKTIVEIANSNPIMLDELEPLNQLASLKPNNSIRSLFFKEGCNLLEASPFKTYVWSQISAFAPISYHSDKSSESMDFSEVRKSTEKALISPELGFGIGVKSKSGYFLESGFQLAYYRERLGYVDPESINVQTIITTDSTFTTSGVVVTTDTTIIQIPGSREVVNYNSHRTVSIPVVLGFDKQINSSFSIGGKVGTIFNLFKESDGRILDEDMVVRDIVHNEGSSVDVYKTRMTAQFLLGSQFRYHFSPSLDVYVSADVRLTAKSITLDSYSLNQRFTSPVIGAGMRYFF